MTVVLNVAAVIACVAVVVMIILAVTSEDM